MREVFNTLMMHWLARFLVLTGSCLALGAWAGEDEAKAYRKALMDCRLFAPQKEIDAALKVLDADDAEVIFELARHLWSEAPAAENFQDSSMELDLRTGKWVLHKPTIGDVAMMLIRWKIEALPGGMHHQIHVINRLNVREWIDARRHLTLRQMQQEAALEGVDQAKKHHAEYHDNFSLNDLALFRENLHALMLGKPPPFSALLRE